MANETETEYSPPENEKSNLTSPETVQPVPSKSGNEHGALFYDPDTKIILITENTPEGKAERHHPFEDFLYELRETGVRTSTSEWLDLQKVLAVGKVKSLDDLYIVGKAVLVKEVTSYPAYDKVFGEMFFGLKVGEAKEKEEREEQDREEQDWEKRNEEPRDEKEENQSQEIVEPGQTEEHHGGEDVHKEIKDSKSGKEGGDEKESEQQESEKSEEGEAGKKPEESIEFEKEEKQSGKKTGSSGQGGNKKQSQSRGQGTETEERPDEQNEAGKSGKGKKGKPSPDDKNQTQDSGEAEEETESVSQSNRPNQIGKKQPQGNGANQQGEKATEQKTKGDELGKSEISKDQTLAGGQAQETAGLDKEKKPGGSKEISTVKSSSSGFSALEEIKNRRFEEYDADRPLSKEQFGRALAKLTDVVVEASEVPTKKLDAQATVRHTAQRGGSPEFVWQEEGEKKPSVVLLFDISGSNDEYRYIMEKLFHDAREHFKDIRTFYFWNAIYGEVSTEDTAKSPTVDLKEVLKEDAESKVIIIGDAWMASGELWGSAYRNGKESMTGMESFQAIKKTFDHAVWLRPIDEQKDDESGTIRELGENFSMYDLTLNGLEKAVRKLMEE